VAKHRFFQWIAPQVLPDSRVNVVALEDDIFFGVLQSRFHEIWALATGSRHGDGDEGGRPTYNSDRCFDAFPFPNGLAPNVPASVFSLDPHATAIAAASKRLNDLRENWLNPPELARREPEVVPGSPDRVLPITEAAAATLRKRTLTNLYNERPTWLANAHADLDAAVAEAYGWPANISEEEALARLFALNQARAASQVTQGELVANANGNQSKGVTCSKRTSK